MKASLHIKTRLQKDHECMDKIHLLNKKIALFQPKQGFKTSQDAVLLAAACPAKNAESVLDMGCGVGGALFSLLWREPDLDMTGLEIEQIYLDLAQKNATENDMTAHFINGDANDFRVNQPKDRFDHIICNPPYFDPQRHVPSPIDIKAKAKGYQSDAETIDLWIKSARDNLKSKGSFTIIHKAEKLDHILALLKKSFGATEIIPIYSKVNEPAKRVIIRSYKDRHSPCLLHAPIIMHDVNTKSSKISDLLLRDAWSFDKLFEEQRNNS